MSSFNLLDEPWIRVVNGKDGQLLEVSLLDVFKNAEDYSCLGGEMETQNFAILRILLAVLHTVFSRVDANGEEYSFIDLDEKYLPFSQVHSDDADDYEEALLDAWQKLWDRGTFPAVIEGYLDAWRDQFFLFDDRYPFMQVKAEDISASKINKRKASSVSGKTINRLVSESGNKIALFSPKVEAGKNKESLAASELARWLVTYQGYCGLSDKTTFNVEKMKWSKGWLFDLGGVYLSGDNLFETLLLNLALVHPTSNFNLAIQTPCWEFDSSDLIRSYLSGRTLDNIASLYTSWSRAVYIDPAFDENKPFEMYVVKLPELNHENPEIELMTLWRVSTDEKDKGDFKPRRHNENVSLWRSFGLIALPDSIEGGQKRVTLIKWLHMIEELIGDKAITLNSISMKPDGNATSWLPKGEISDSLHLSDFILTDLAENGWVPRINDAIEKTKHVVEKIYGGFLKDISDIRNTSSQGFVSQGKAELYFLIDLPFRNWIESISLGSNKEDKILDWYQQLYKISSRQAEVVLSSSGTRDFLGREVGNENSQRYLNAPIAYNKFVNSLRKALPMRGVKDEQ